jgi:hypothetical protein
MSSDISRLAESRFDVFCPEQVVKQIPGIEGSQTYLKQRAETELILELLKRGMPANLAILFIQLLWRANADLKHGCSAAGLAADIGKYRTNVSRSLRDLEGIGVIGRTSAPYSSGQWYFLRYEELLKKVEAYYQPEDAEPIP